MHEIVYVSDETVLKAWSKWSHVVSWELQKLKQVIIEHVIYQSSRDAINKMNVKVDETWENPKPIHHLNEDPKQALNEDGEERLNRSTWRPHVKHELQYLILLFFKDAFIWSNVTAKTFIMLQKIYFSNKCCSLNFLFIKESWKIKCIKVST